MLVLSRKLNESIMIGENVEVKIIDIKGDQVKVGIIAPRYISVYRKEIYEEIQKENKAAVALNKNAMQSLEGIGIKDLKKKGKTLIDD